MHMFSRLGIQRRFSLAMIMAVLAVVALLTAVVFQARKKAYTDSVDTRLLTAANSARTLLPGDGVDRIKDETSPSREEFPQIVPGLDQLCRQVDLNGLWRLALLEGRMVLTTANSIETDLGHPEDTVFLTRPPHQEAIRHALSTMKTEFHTFKDQRGKNRMVLVPGKDRQGHLFLFAASAKLDQIGAILGWTLIEALAFGATFLFLGFWGGATLLQKLETLRARSEQTQKLLLATNTGYVIIDQQGQVIDANEEYLRLTGRKRMEDIKGHNILEWTAPHDRDRNVEEVRKNFEVEPVRNLEIDYVHPDGSTLPVEINASVVQLASRGFSHAVCRDITERKRVEAVLRLNESRMAGLLKLARMVDHSERDLTDFALETAIELTSSSIGYLAFLNEDETEITMYSWSKEALAECGVLNKVNRYQVASTGLWGEAVRQRRPIITNDFQAPNPLKRGLPDGHVKVTRHMNVPLFDGDRIVLVAGVGNKIEPYDETDVKQLTLLMDGMWKIIRHRRTMEERNRFFNLSLDMLCIGNFNGYLTQVNPAFSRALGWTSEELISKPWIEFVHPEDQARSLEEATNFLAGKSLLGFENRFRCKDGTWRLLSWNTFPLPEEQLIFALVRDLTEIRRLEERLRQTEKMDAIGQLAGGIAHDFNNQLTGILGFAELLVRRSEDPILRQYAGNILNSSRRAGDLTRELLAFARKGKFRVVSVDLHALIAEVAMLLERSIDKRIVLKLDLQAQTPSIAGDPTQLQNAFLNLGLNARDAMPQGGEIRFETKIVELDERHCREKPYDVVPGRYVRISVTDDGTGMDPETRKHLFEPFFTTKGPGKGTGMGLAAVYGTVKNHKGSIDVQSEVGRGTSVQIHLPLAVQAAEESSDLFSEAPKSQGVRILVVDDEEVVRDLLAEMLNTLGHTVTLCQDGPEALEWYRKEWHKTDLVIFDMVMPKMSGRDLFRGLQKINPEVRALLSSGYSIDGEAQAILAAGVLGFLQKPFVRSELAQAVEQVLGQTVSPI